MSTLYNTHIPLALPLCQRAKNDADRLWAEHNFNFPDLLEIPRYLKDIPTTSFQADIQTELIIKWHLAITLHLAREANTNSAVMFTPKYKILKARADELAGKAEVWQQEVQRLQRKKPGLLGIPRQLPVPQARNVPSQRPLMVPRGQPVPLIMPQRQPGPPSTSAKTAPNHGFSATTTIIPFKAGVTRSAETEERDERAIIILAKKVKTNDEKEPEATLSAR
jgi:hypothetical protein